MRLTGFVLLAFVIAACNSGNGNGSGSAAAKPPAPAPGQQPPANQEKGKEKDEGKTPEPSPQAPKLTTFQGLWKSLCLTSSNNFGALRDNEASQRVDISFEDQKIVIAVESFIDSDCRVSHSKLTVEGTPEVQATPDEAVKLVVFKQKLSETQSQSFFMRMKENGDELMTTRFSASERSANAEEIKIRLLREPKYQQVMATEDAKKTPDSAILMNGTYRSVENPRCTVVVGKGRTRPNGLQDVFITQQAGCDRPGKTWVYTCAGSGNCPENMTILYQQRESFKVEFLSFDGPAWHQTFELQK